MPRRPGPPGRLVHLPVRHDVDGHGVPPPLTLSRRDVPGRQRPSKIGM
jgi:hypothetical protein